MMATTASVPLDKYGYNYIARQVFTGLVLGILPFVGAGTTDWPWGWVYFAFSLIGWVGMTIWVARQNPSLLNQRGQRANALEGTKRWDWLLLALYTFALFGVHLAAGLDYRAGNTLDVVWLRVIGVVVMMVGFWVLAWAMNVNRFFETTVRIQEARGQRPISDGPYRYVRHPGYLGVILQFLATPLILGSTYAWIVALAGIVVFIVRTALEDRTLQQELPGYADFARQTRYRLLPGVW